MVSPPLGVLDVAGWRRETMPRFEVAPHHRIVPDWVCEVLNPRMREYDVTEKRAVYARHGVGHLWFLDPDARTLEAFTLEAGSWRFLGAARGEAEVRMALFDAAAIPLAPLWVPRS